MLTRSYHKIRRFIMPSTKYIIELNETERKILMDIVKKGNSPARTIMRANILLASDRGNKHMTISEIELSAPLLHHQTSKRVLICCHILRLFLLNTRKIHQDTLLKD